MNSTQRSETRELLKRALALARGSMPGEAIAMLDRGLLDARTRQDQKSVSLLARNAALISAHEGNLDNAARYYEVALGSDPADAYLYFAAGEVYRRLGDNARARQTLARCLELATQQGDSDLIKMAAEAQVGPDH